MTKEGGQLTGLEARGSFGNAAPARAILAGAILLLLVNASAQEKRESTITGRVVEGGTGRPVADASILLVASPRNLTATSRADGSFEIRSLDRLHGVRLEVAKAGYLTGFRAQLRPTDSFAGTLRFDVADGGRFDVGIVRLWPEGSLVGRVTDAAGVPVIGASVYALTEIPTGLGPRWARATVPARTNDRGDYRIGRLVPGTYRVMARFAGSGAGSLLSAVPTYFPAVDSVGAAVDLFVDGGPQTANIQLIDFRRVSFVAAIQGADRSLAGSEVRMYPLLPDGSVTEFDEVTAIVDKDQTVRFSGLAQRLYRARMSAFPPSEVTLYSVGGDFTRQLAGFLGPLPPGHPALPPLPSGTTWVADQNIDLRAGPSVNGVIHVEAGRRIAGTVIFDGRTSPPTATQLSRVPVVVRPADGGSLGISAQPRTIPQSPIDPQGRFRSIGLPQGDYIVNVLPGLSELGDWTTASILIEGQETAGGAFRLNNADINGVRILLTDLKTELFGTVVSGRDGRRQPARVVIFPQANSERNQFLAYPAPRRVLQTNADEEGAFRAQVLPGSYFVVAVEDLPPDWTGPAKLAEFASRGTSVTVNKGEQRRIEVVVR